MNRLLVTLFSNELLKHICLHIDISFVQLYINLRELFDVKSILVEEQ